MTRGERSDLIAYDGLRYAPENELGVVLLFGKLHRTWASRKLIPEKYADIIEWKTAVGLVPGRR